MEPVSSCGNLPPLFSLYHVWTRAGVESDMDVYMMVCSR